MSYLIQIAGKKIPSVSKETSYIYPLEISGVEPQSSTPVEEVIFSLENYTLTVTNKFTLSPSSNINDLVGFVVQSIFEHDSYITLTIFNGVSVTIDLSDEAY